MDCGRRRAASSSRSSTVPSRSRSRSPASAPTRSTRRLACSRSTRRRSPSWRSRSASSAAWAICSRASRWSQQRKEEALNMEIGIYTFAERTPDASGHLVSAEQRLADLLEEIELADEIGLDVFGIGEHHRPDFLDSAPTIILAAAAARTKNIRLSS